MVPSIAVKSNLANPSYYSFPCSCLAWHMFGPQGSLSSFLKGYFLIINSCPLFENVQSLWIQTLLPLTILGCQCMTTFPSLTFIDEFSIWTPTFLSLYFCYCFWWFHHPCGPMLSRPVLPQWSFHHLTSVVIFLTLLSLILSLPPKSPLQSSHALRTTFCTFSLP